MKKFLFITLALLLSVLTPVKAAESSTEPVDVTISWPMAASGDEYTYDFTPVISAEVQGITASKPALGTELSWKEARGINSVPFALVQPSVQVKEATEGHTVTFSIEIEEGYTFVPTGFDYKASVIGTNGGNYNLDYTWNGETKQLQNNYHPNRNNAEGGYYSTVALPIEGASAASGKFEVTFSIYGLGNTKQIGLSDVVIKGKIQAKAEEPDPVVPDQPGDATVLYERTADTWTEADLTEWVNNNENAKQEIDGGLKVTSKNIGWTSTKAITYSENTTVTLTASLQGGTAPGRNTSYDYFKLGSVEVRLYGQDQKAKIVIGDEETDLQGYKRGGIYNLTMVVDQATKNVTVSVEGDATGNAEGQITEVLPANVVFGHLRGGSEGSWDITVTLKDIKIAEEIKEVATASYTINYLLNGTLITSETGETAVGTIVSAKSPLTVDGKKYYFAEEEGFAIMVNADIENVLNVDMREANVYNIAVSNNVNGDVKEYTCVEGEPLSIPYSKYILATDGTIWQKDVINKEYKLTITPEGDMKLELIYEVTEMTNGIWFSEAENIEGLTATNSGQIDARGSNAAGAYSAEAVEVYTLKPGTYKIEAAVAGNAGETITVKAGETKLAAVTTGSWTSYSTEEFTVKTETAITVQGGASQKPLDYILITGKEDILVSSVTITDKDGKQLENLELTEGDEYQLSATVAPEDATYPTVTWSSSDEAIATVDENGKVTAVAAGEVVITAEAGGKTAECKITVAPAVIEVADITLDQTEATIKVGETLELKATVTPADATDPTVTWSTSNEAVATVDENGKVTAVAEGEAVITAKAGDKTAECTVKVDKTTGVALIGFDPEAPVQVYNLNGIYVSDSIENLEKGTYIIRQGNNAKKVSIR